MPTAPVNSVPSPLFLTWDTPGLKGRAPGQLCSPFHGGALSDLPGPRLSPASLRRLPLM